MDPEWPTSGRQIGVWFMRSEYSSKLAVRFLISFVLIAMMTTAAYAQPPTLLWKDDTVGVNDVAVSKNGQYVVAATIGSDGAQVRFYDRSSSDPKKPIWAAPSPSQPTPGIEVYAVAISADGYSVVAAFHEPGTSTQQGPPEYGIAYWKNAMTVDPSNPQPTWVSGPNVASGVNLDGPVCFRCLDISDDGNYVAVATQGAPDTVYYYAGAMSRSTYNENATAWGGDSPFTALDMSSDGNYLAVGVLGHPSGYAVAYLKNARALPPGPIGNPSWMSSTDEPVVDVAISDDGNYVVAATGGVGSVYYWTGASGLGGDNAPASWHGGLNVAFSSVDMSSDGGSVVAGAVDGVYFWGGARSLSGTPASSWSRTTADPVMDVAIDHAGDYMAAGTGGPLTVYFYDNMGDLKWSYPVDASVSALSISSDGGTLAVGTYSQAVTPASTAYLLDTGFKTPLPAPIPEYPLGLLLLGIFMVIAYGLIRRKRAVP